MQEPMNTELTYIGKIHTPYKKIDDCPRNIQPNGPLCELKVDSELQCELRGLKERSAILVLYWLGKPKNGVGYVPITNENEPGTFAMRTPYRPNPIGAAVVTIEKVELNSLYVKGLDCLDGTYLLDIKPAIFHELSNQATQNIKLEGCDCDKSEI